ncbi:MAG: IclR family transcriptional regulator [candidate division WOR-3 bacterium]|nr:IclR family transcriptional regulator [Candidatus Omnitrophota bacterium]MCM8807074.1 IclR family transcriptional regulator [Candidatus Omnitrophota bacterium]
MKVKVVEKIMKIIEIISNSENEGLSVGEISKFLNLKITTTHSLLSTLLSLGYLEKDKNTKKYRISEKLLNIFYPLLSKNFLIKISEPVMKNLAENIKESVVLGIFYKGERYTIAQVSYENNLLNVNLNMFQKASCYSTATGRILLSYLPEKEVKEYIRKNGYPKETWNNIRNFRDLKKEFEKIRKRKIEIIEKEGTVAIGVPIFSSDKKIIASLGVYLPTVRFRKGNRERIINELKKAGEEITLKLGDKI